MEKYLSEILINTKLIGIKRIVPIIANAKNHLNDSTSNKDQYMSSLNMLSKNNAMNIEKNDMKKPRIKLANKYPKFPLLIFK